jgi:phospholipid/cholesterol/gamma-HCH transport system permease protein
MSFLENIGQQAVRIFKSVSGIIFFAEDILFRIFKRSTYTSAMRTLLIDQIYFTSVQILPVFLSVSIVLGSLLVGIIFYQLKEMGLTQYFGDVLMNFIVNEFSPFITVIWITLRSGSAIGTEMATMKVNKEIKTLETFHIDVANYLLVPRIINGVISLVLMSSLFSIVLLGAGILCSRMIFGIGMDVYSNILLSSADFSDIIISLGKSAIFGFFITLIPIRFGLQASHELTSIPIVVSRGMVNVFAAIMTIEVLSLIAKSF